MSQVKTTSRWYRKKLLSVEEIFFYFCFVRAVFVERKVLAFWFQITAFVNLAGSHRRLPFSRTLTLAVWFRHRSPVLFWFGLPSAFSPTGALSSLFSVSKTFVVFGKKITYDCQMICWDFFYWLDYRFGCLHCVFGMLCIFFSWLQPWLYYWS